MIGDHFFFCHRQAEGNNLLFALIDPIVEKLLPNQAIR
jgi:hypothetical protein